MSLYQLGQLGYVVLKSLGLFIRTFWVEVLALVDRIIFASNGGEPHDDLACWSWTRALIFNRYLPTFPLTTNAEYVLALHSETSVRELTFLRSESPITYR